MRHGESNPSLRLAFILTIMLAGCSGSPDLDFDHSSWKEDPMGCQLKRKKIYPDLIGEKQKLLELDSKKIIRILGNPDRNELYRRNQKFFIYHISPAPSCTTYHNTKEALYLMIRINALGLSSEIYLSEKHSPTTN